jgi:hypothetical protein
MMVGGGRPPGRVSPVKIRQDDPLSGNKIFGGSLVGFEKIRNPFGG